MLAATPIVAGQVAGVAGVSADSDRLWQIGVDVRAPYRGAGIATALMGRVAEAVLAAGRVPSYATALGNLISARVALRLGFAPAWVAAYTRASDRRQDAAPSA